ncbi:MAG: hypothetical protein KF833_01620 [Verrucomicrobiae bacterium]|nr:hypothetical protein [Verrucomicrobiae bacterium]
MSRLAEALPPQPGLRWQTLPEGWVSHGAEGLRVANFTISGSDDRRAELAVIPLPGTGGTDVDLVNLWRGQLSLAPIGPEALPAHTDETEIAGQPIKLFNIVGSESYDTEAQGHQILVAALRRDGFTWFFKLAGDAPVVEAQRQPLKAFLGQVEFTAPSAEAGSRGVPVSTAGATGRPPSARWQVPGAWEATEPTAMVHSKWLAPGGSATSPVEITVSVLPGDAGGLVPNLNRWRSQVGLPPAPDGELAALSDNLEVLGGKGTLVDFNGSSPEHGTPLRMVAAVVKRDGHSWYYKLMGPPEAVGAQRDAFVSFVQTAQYSRGS